MALSSNRCHKRLEKHFDNIYIGAAKLEGSSPLPNCTDADVDQTGAQHTESSSHTGLPLALC